MINESYALSESHVLIDADSDKSIGICCIVSEMHIVNEKHKAYDVSIYTLIDRHVLTDTL